MIECCEVVLFMDSCRPDRLVANRILMVTRSTYLIEVGRDITHEDYLATLEGSGNAGIIRE
jgi:hypothetical protein